MGAYNENKVPLKPPFKELNISLNWRDGFGTTGKQFSNVNELAEFLRANPVLAEAVGYIPKSIKK